MKVSRMGRRRSESISSSSSMSSRSNGTVSLHQAKSLDSLDQSESTSSSVDSTDRPAWKRKNYQTISHHQSTISSCESSGQGSSSSSYWSRSDGRSSSSQSLCTGDSESSVSVRQNGYRQLQSSHPKQQRTGSDCKMLAMFSCCLDRRHQSSTLSSSRWTETPDYGKLPESYSSPSLSLESSSDSLNDMGHHSSHRTGSASHLVVKVPNQR